MDNKLETAILEKEALDGIDGDFEDNFQDSYDNGISHNYTSNKELYGKAQHLMSEKGTSSKYVSDDNYSHIAYVLECMEDELDEKTVKTMTMKRMLSMQTITTQKWNTKMSNNLQTVFQN